MERIMSLFCMATSMDARLNSGLECVTQHIVHNISRWDYDDDDDDDDDDIYS